MSVYTFVLSNLHKYGLDGENLKFNESSMFNIQYKTYIYIYITRAIIILYFRFKC
jgi:hypothetical protein